MIHQKFPVILAVILLAVVYSAKAVKQKGASEIDDARSAYMQLENASWAIVENDVDRKHVLKYLFDGHRNFAGQYLKRNFYGSEFIILEKFYEWKLLEKDLMTLNSLFETFRLLLDQHVDVYDDLVNNDFAETVLTDKHFPINETLDQIENIMVKQSLYYRALKEADSQVCTTRQSAQQVLYQLYSAISITELKGYAMMQFSWMLLKTYGKGNYTRESQLMHQSFLERTAKTQELLRHVMSLADRIVWRCDPSQHVEGDTYVAVTRLLQGFIENEVDMNNDGTCKENCAAYQFAENQGCFKDLYCAKQPKCTGKLLNCQFVDSDMWICPSKSASLRRYEYIEYENGRVLGQKGSCSRGTTKVDSWWRWIFWHCSYCMCICDEQSAKSDRYFNLREATSNISENKVVTGLRFRKVNRIIHLQIQEAQLLPRGNVNPATVEWKPVSDYKLLDRGVRNNIDYHTMAWDKRAIDLDDLKAKPGHVVTGVRFRTVGKHLNLEMRVTEVDFVTGRLIDPETSVWVSNDNTETSGDERRTALKLKRPDIPTKSKSKSIPTSKNNQFIEFTHTEIDSDVAQTTVPYIDAQDVTSFPPVPLTGVGIYHKGQDLYGGFVAPKLITFDFAPHIQTPQPKDDGAILHNLNAV